jgi:hypothetical protein
MNDIPLTLNNSLSVLKLNVTLSEYNRLYEAERRLASPLPKFNNAMLSNVPGTSFGRMTRSEIFVGLMSS